MESWKADIEKKREQYRIEQNLPKIEDYGMAKTHYTKSKEIYDFISEVDFANGDAFCFKKGGDGDNGEILMDLFDAYFNNANQPEKMSNEKTTEDLLKELQEAHKKEVKDAIEDFAEKVISELNPTDDMESEIIYMVKKVMRSTLRNE